MFRCYGDINDAQIPSLLRKPGIKTENHLMNFSDYSWQDCPDTGRSTGAYIIFYQGVTIYRGTLVPEPVSQPSSESEYNGAFNSGMAFQDVN